MKKCRAEIVGKAPTLMPYTPQAGNKYSRQPQLTAAIAVVTDRQPLAANGALRLEKPGVNLRLYAHRLH